MGSHAKRDPSEGVSTPAVNQVTPLLTYRSRQCQAAPRRSCYGFGSGSTNQDPETYLLYLKEGDLEDCLATPLNKLTPLASPYDWRVSVWAHCIIYTVSWSLLPVMYLIISHNIHPLITISIRTNHMILLTKKNISVTTFPSLMSGFNIVEGCAPFVTWMS